MLEYQRLFEEDRQSRRAVTDAVAVLRNHGFTQHDRANIRVGRLRLPSGEIVGFTEVLFDAPWEDKGYSVALRTAVRFRGRRKGSTQYEDFEIIRLNGAEVDAGGVVKLADGTELYAIELLTAPMLTEPSELDWRIVHAALKFIDGGDRCYRSPRDGLPPAQSDFIPDERILDCAKLPDLKAPPLKDIVQGVKCVDPALNISGQKIADALRKFGIRVPVPRPRVKGTNAR